MALNSATLSSAIKGILASDPHFEDNASAQTLCDAIAQAVVAHIIANAVVTVAPGIAVATTGTAAAQAGATTAPGLGTIT